MAERDRFRVCRVAADFVTGPFAFSYVQDRTIYGDYQFKNFIKI